MNHRHYFDKPLEYVGKGRLAPVNLRLTPKGVADIATDVRWQPTMLQPVEHEHIGGDVPHLHATTTSEPVTNPVPGQESSS